MKIKLLIFFVLVCIAIGVVIIRILFVNSKAQFGNLKISSTPSSTVFIDNVAVGRTPFEERIKVGEYAVKLIPEGNATDSASWTGKVNIFRSSLTYVSRELGNSDVTSSGEVLTVQKMEKRPRKPQYGEVVVETDPQGAIVYLDTDEKGIAPLVLEDVLQGEHELSVLLPGFTKRFEKINVEPGYRVSAQFKLSLDSSQARPTAIPEPSISSASASQKITILDTSTGWLRVRSEPNLSASESGKVIPGETFSLIEETVGWYKIKNASIEGWVSSQFSEKKSN